MAERAHVLVGTRKGAFIYTADQARKKWEISEPILAGWSVYNLAADRRAGETHLYAGANHWAWGRSVAKSDDGKEWNWVSEGLGFPEDMGVAVQNVWCVSPGHESEPGVVYAGTQPAGLFKSTDWGHTWTSVDSINRHESRPHWGGTGGGESCIHSIEVDPRDPRRIYLAISSGGSFVTSDGGKTWSKFSQSAVPQTEKARAFTQWVMEQFPQGTRPVPEDVDPLAIDEMHKMRLDQKNPDRIWTQTHVGVFLSEDRGKTFSDVTEGLPSFHGFPIAVSRSGPDAAYVVPLEMEEANFRVVRDQFAVYRTRDSGKSWEKLTRGLPGPDDYQSVYREGLDTDGLEPEGVYVGTSNGAVFASANGGDSWQRLPGTLPPILSVTCAVY